MRIRKNYSPLGSWWRWRSCYDCYFKDQTVNYYEKS